VEWFDPASAGSLRHATCGGRREMTSLLGAFLFAGWETRLDEKGVGARTEVCHRCHVRRRVADVRDVADALTRRHADQLTEDSKRRILTIRQRNDGVIIEVVSNRCLKGLQPGDRMLSAVQRCGLSTSLCTIYDANYPDPQRQIIVSALALFNDVITRAAFKRGLPLIDLRLICDLPEDYANPIEPSVRGGDKIASAIVQAVATGSAGDRSVVIASA
jgi:hypothetical protein